VESGDKALKYLVNQSWHKKLQNYFQQNDIVSNPLHVFTSGNTMRLPANQIQSASCQTNKLGCKVWK
jgi:hypothetical protein